MAVEQFAGKILVLDYVAQDQSVFTQTAWDTDAETVPTQQVSAFSITEWDTDAACEPNVIGIKSTVDNWS